MRQVLGAREEERWFSGFPWESHQSGSVGMCARRVSPESVMPSLLRLRGTPRNSDITNSGISIPASGKKSGRGGADTCRRIESRIPWSSAACGQKRQGGHLCPTASLSSCSIHHLSSSGFRGGKDTTIPPSGPRKAKSLPDERGREPWRPFSGMKPVSNIPWCSSREWCLSA